MQVANIITVYLGHMFTISKRSAENVQKENVSHHEALTFQGISVFNIRKRENFQ